MAIHGDIVTCHVRVFDGDDYSAEATASLVILDTTPPTTPVFGSSGGFVNSSSVNLSGTCEAGCSLSIYCADSSLSWVESDVCASDGTFNLATTLNLGLNTECYATCEDYAGNLSAPSSNINLEACDPSDSYESLGGDSSSTAIDQWGAIHDDNSTSISIYGNILDDDTSDWYVLSASDDLSEDIADGYDNFRFAVEFTMGSSDYAFTVYAGSPTDLECSDTGYTSYDDNNVDVAEGAHGVPSNPQACGIAGTQYNECVDDSKEYYIHVFRKTTVSSCQGYEIAISNGVW